MALVAVLDGLPLLGGNVTTEIRKILPLVLSPLFVQLMHTNYYKIVKQLKSFNIIIVAPTCFGLHKPSSRNLGN